MSRDGLLPNKFQEIHPKYKTPAFATIVTGLLVGLPIFFTDKTFVLDFTSIGTLFAFVLVCGGVLLIPRRPKTPGKFHLPYINSKFIFPAIVIAAVVLILTYSGVYFRELFNGDFTDYSDAANSSDYLFQTAAVKIATILFWVISLVLAALSFSKNLSLIPLLGLISCLYLLTGMSGSNWKWFFVWFAIGLIIYFIYGYRKSKLQEQHVTNQ
jgi:basic amino acid/polyamine antiporter, APA family